jgi:peroxiredoxin
VVDIVEQVKATAPKGVAFIHQEIYKDNQVNKGVRPQVAAWRLASEPWTFVIDRRGRISTRFEGAYSVGELQRAVAKVARTSA